MSNSLYSRVLAIILLIGCGMVNVQAQFKPPHHSRNITQEVTGNFIDIQNALSQFQQGKQFSNNRQTTPHSRDIIRSETGVPIYIDLSRLDYTLPHADPETRVMTLLESQAGVLQILSPDNELALTRVTEDDKGNRVFRYVQLYGGIPIHNSDLLVHGTQDRITAINGRWFPTEHVDLSGPFISPGEALAIVEKETGMHELKGTQLDLVGGKQMEIELRIKRLSGGASTIVYFVSVHPTIAEHLNILVDASNGSILESVSMICNMAHSWTPNESRGVVPIVDPIEVFGNVIDQGFDGDVIVNDQDLNGTTHSIHVYQSGQEFFMVDISRDMYDASQSNLPDEPAGAIWTLDGNGGSPESQNFSVSHVHSSNNQWAPLEVSAHWNSSTAYEYFTETFGRNSINGDGGTIISVIDVKEQNGQDMDNAFWNGQAMFYGNGDEAFSSPLARSLDVAGHEMSHGVIQNTANLEYAGQSGAMNESFADIFGAMIDRDDWLLGETVVNTSFFPSGALRDMQNPNNGGSQFGDNGWQPKHMSEYVELPNTPQGDNGGVHINSGISNRAYYLFATDVGKNVAEKVYYRALSNYLVRSSQFVDMRIAVVKAAGDLHGAESSVVVAARDAFDAVGILGDEGGNYEDEIDMNPGDAFLLVSNNSLDDLFLLDPMSSNVFELDVPPPFSKPSISDDGTVAVYVDQNGFLKAILFDWSQSTLNYEVIDIETTPQPIWRSIAISKDGLKISFLTDELQNVIHVFDFQSQSQQGFELYNPTTGSGGAVTGGVQYADVMEWDYSGQRIVYDAFNVIDGTFGNDIEYWDIGFLRVWDNAPGEFGSGQVQKLFSGLPENVSVGNPSLSKNSPHIMVFDFLENDIFGGQVLNWAIFTANTQSGRVELLFENDALGYPNYSGSDGIVIFDTKDPEDNSQLVIGAIDTQVDDIMLPVEGTARVFVDGARYGTWFQTGTRDVTSSLLNGSALETVRIWPNPVSDELSIELNEPPDTNSFLRIFNALGYEVSIHRISSDQSQYQIDVGGLPAGMYTAQISTNGRVQVGKFLKVE